MATVRIPLTTPLRQRLALIEAKALEGARARSVIALARALCEQGGRGPWWWLRPLVAVQALPIVGDAAGVDEYRDAVETLARGGDCANKTALLAALYIAARPFCGRSSVSVAWEHCGRDCAFDHVRLGLRVDDRSWMLDALSPGLLPGDRAVSWAPQEIVLGRWL